MMLGSNPENQFHKNKCPQMFLFGKLVFLKYKVFKKMVQAQWKPKKAPHLTNPFCHELFILRYFKCYIEAFFDTN